MSNNLPIGDKPIYSDQFKISEDKKSLTFTFGGTEHKVDILSGLQNWLLTKLGMTTFIKTDPKDPTKGFNVRTADLTNVAFQEEQKSLQTLGKVQGWFESMLGRAAWVKTDSADPTKGLYVRKAGTEKTGRLFTKAVLVDLIKDKPALLNDTRYAAYAKDSNFMFALIQKNPNALLQADKSLLGNKNFMDKVLNNTETVNALKSLPKDSMLLVLKHTPEAFEHASYELRTNSSVKEFVNDVMLNKTRKASVTEYPESLNDYVKAFPHEAVQKTIGMLKQYSDMVNGIDVKQLDQKNLGDAAKIINAFRLAGSGSQTKENIINYIFNTGSPLQLNNPEDTTAILKKLLVAINDSAKYIDKKELKTLKDAVSKLSESVVSKGQEINKLYKTDKKDENAAICINDQAALLKAATVLYDLLGIENPLEKQMKEMQEKMAPSPKVQKAAQIKEKVLEPVKPKPLSADELRKALFTCRACIKVSEHNWTLATMHESFRNDEALVRDLIAGDPSKYADQLQYVGPALKNDKKFMMEMYTTYPESIAGEKDKNTILQAAQKNAAIFSHLDNDFKNDRNFLLELVEKNAEIFKLIPEKESFFLFRDAFQKNPSVIKYADPTWFNDHLFLDYTLKTIGNVIELSGGIAFKDLPHLVKVNPEIALKAVQRNGLALKDIDPKIANYSELVNEAIKQNHLALQFVDEGTKEYSAIVNNALTKNPLDLQFAKGAGVNYINALKAVKNDGMALQFVDPKVLGYDELVEEAIKNNPLALQFAQGTALNVTTALLAVKKNGMALQFAGDELNKNKEIVLEAFKNNSASFQFAHKELKNNRDLVLTIVDKNGLSLEFVDDSLKKNIDVVRKAINQSAASIQHVHDDFKKDPAVIDEALNISINKTKITVETKRFNFLKHISTELKNNSTFWLKTLAAISDQWDNMKIGEDASVALSGYDGLQIYEGIRTIEVNGRPLLEDETFLLDLVEKSPNALQLLPEKFRDNPGFILKAVAKNGLALKFVPPELQTNEIILKSIQQNPRATNLVDPKMMQAKQFSSEILAQTPSALQFFPDNFQLEAIRENPLSLQYASKNVKNDQTVIDNALKQNGLALQFLDPSQKVKKENVLKATEQNGLSLEFVKDEITKDPAGWTDIVNVAIKQNPASFRLLDKQTQVVLKEQKQLSNELLETQARKALDLKNCKKALIEYTKSNPTESISKTLKIVQEYSKKLRETQDSEEANAAIVKAFKVSELSSGARDLRLNLVDLLCKDTSTSALKGDYNSSMMFAIKNLFDIIDQSRLDPSQTDAIYNEFNELRSIVLSKNAKLKELNPKHPDLIVEKQLPKTQSQRAIKTFTKEEKQQITDTTLNIMSKFLKSGSNDSIITTNTHDTLKKINKLPPEDRPTMTLNELNIVRDYLTTVDTDPKTVITIPETTVQNLMKNGKVDILEFLYAVDNNILYTQKSMLGSPFDRIMMNLGYLE